MTDSSAGDVRRLRKMSASVLFRFSTMGKFLLIVCISGTTIVDAHRILIYAPTLSHSHVSFNGKLADLLVKAGHEVVLLLVDIDPLVATNGSRQATVMRVSVNIERTLLTRTLWQNPGPFEDSSILNRKIALKLWKIGNIMIDVCEALASNARLLDTLRRFRFDIGMLEQYDSCGFGLLQSLRIPTRVWLSATAIFRMQPTALGVDYPLSFVPELFAPFSDEMPFGERLANYGIAQVTGLLFRYHAQTAETAIFRRRNGGDFPDLLQLSAGSQLSLINSMSLFDFPAPLLGNMLFSGGFTNTVDRDYRRPLSKEWLRIADSALNGIVLMSFGAITQTADMPSDMQTTMFNVFAHFPNYTFIVKYENVSSTQRVAANVYLTNWIPQVELMAHRKYRALITQAGWSSIIEALLNGSPMILMPLFADHYKNAKVVEKRRVGVILDKMHFTTNTFIRALSAVLHDSSYTQNARRYSRMLVDVPMQVEQHLMHQVNFAERYHRRLERLLPAGARLPVVQFHFFDVSALMTLFGAAICFIIRS